MGEPNSSKTIVLFRGDAGLGFNIRGGVDNPHIPGDTGIFVTKIRSEGAAFKDGTLKEGDKIISINGDSLVDVTHDEAVRCFTKAKDRVELVVQCGAQAEIMQKRKQKALNQNNSNNPDGILSNIQNYVMVGGIAGISLLLGFFFYKRYVLH